MNLNLDYNIELASERCAAINRLVNNHKFTNRQLEVMANYVLYGKSESGAKLAVAKEITPKHTTWRRKQPDSLDQLMDNVLFDEQTVRPAFTRSVYTNPKPTIDRETDSDIPGMTQLWRAIDDLEAFYNEVRAQSGRSINAYYLRHTLIALRKEQYHLKDIHRPTIQFMRAGYLASSPQEFDWNGDSGYAFDPLIVDINNTEYVGRPDWIWNEIAEHTIDLTNPTHIYHILTLYSALRHHVHDHPHSHTAYLLLAVERLVDRAELAPSRTHILVRKVDGATNEVIAQELRQKFGLDYAINYISTIWSKEICGAVAAAGSVDKREWFARHSPQKWKRCIVCKTDQLADLEFFAHKKGAYDGLSPICRKCKRKERVR